MRHEMKWTAQAFATLAEQWLATRKTTTRRTKTMRSACVATAAAAETTSVGAEATAVGPETTAVGAEATSVGAEATSVGPGTRSPLGVHEALRNVDAVEAQAYHAGYSFYAGYWAHIFGQLAKDAQVLWASTQNA